MSLLRALIRYDSMTRCPYRTRSAKCLSGCWEEPRCITDEPVKGWPLQRFKDKARPVGKCHTPRGE